MSLHRSEALGIQTPPTGVEAVEQAGGDVCPPPPKELTTDLIPEEPGTEQATEDYTPAAATPVVHDTSAPERKSRRVPAVVGVGTLAAATALGIAGYFASTGGDTASAEDPQANPSPTVSASVKPGSTISTPTPSSSSETSPTNIPESSTASQGFKVNYEGAGQLNTTERLAGVPTFEYTPSLGDSESVLTMSEVPDPAKYPVQALEATWAIIDAAQSEPNDAKATALLEHLAPQSSPVFKRLMKDRSTIQDWFKANGTGILLTADTVDYPVDISFNAEKQVVELGANTGQGMQRFVIRFPGNQKTPHYDQSQFGYGAQLTSQRAANDINTLAFGYELVDGKWTLTKYFVNAPYPGK